MILVCNDRPGALEVLDFMTEQQVSGSDRIKGMLKTNLLWKVPILGPARESSAQSCYHGAAAKLNASLKQIKKLDDSNRVGWVDEKFRKLVG